MEKRANVIHITFKYTDAYFVQDNGVENILICSFKKVLVNVFFVLFALVNHSDGKVLICHGPCAFHPQKQKRS